MKHRRHLPLVILFTTLVGFLCIAFIQTNPGKDSGFIVEQNSDISESSNLPPSTFPGKIVKIDRFIKVGQHGLFSTIDSITFKNDQSSVIQEFYFCLNRTDADLLYDMEVKEMAGASCEVKEELFSLYGFVPYRVLFSKPLMPGEVMKFDIFLYFGDKLLVTVNETDANFEINHHTITITPYNSETVTVEIRLPSSSIINDDTKIPSTMENKPGSTVPTQILIYQNNTPYEYFYLHLEFVNNLAGFIETMSSRKKIEINNYRNWYVTDHVIIKNIGKQSISTLTFTVPGDAQDIKAWDFIGEIKGLKEEDPYEYDDPDTTYPFINISITLATNRYALTSENMIEFTFSFSLPAGSRISTGVDENFIFLDVFQICTSPWLMREVEITVALPYATELDLNYLNIMPQAVDSSDGYLNLVYQEDYLAPESSSPIVIKYKYSTFGYQSRPLLIALVAGLILSFAIIARKVSIQREVKTGVSKVREIPVDELKEFTTIFEEKIALYLEMDRINADFKRRKIKKREFSIKIEDSSNRLRHLEDDIFLSKKKLMEFGGRFREIIEELDVLEAERQAVQDSILALERRYKSGKIKSRIAYDKLYDNYTIRLKKIQGSLDSGINELKSFYL
ncbi:MAG: hypothetical protein ACFFCS_07790 [Candidatus Hodarchaeota archaeon]